MCFAFRRLNDGSGQVSKVLRSIRKRPLNLLQSEDFEIRLEIQRFEVGGFPRAINLEKVKSIQVRFLSLQSRAFYLFSPFLSLFLSLFLLLLLSLFSFPFFLPLNFKQCSLGTTRARHLVEGDANTCRSSSHLFFLFLLSSCQRGIFI